MPKRHQDQRGVAVAIATLPRPFISLSISCEVRYSRVRSLALAGRTGTDRKSLLGVTRRSVAFIEVLPLARDIDLPDNALFPVSMQKGYLVRRWRAPNNEQPQQTNVPIDQPIAALPTGVAWGGRMRGCASPSTHTPPPARVEIIRKFGRNPWKGRRLQRWRVFGMFKQAGFADNDIAFTIRPGKPIDRRLNRPTMRRLTLVASCCPQLLTHPSRRERHIRVADCCSYNDPIYEQSRSSGACESWQNRSFGWWRQQL